MKKSLKLVVPPFLKVVFIPFFLSGCSGRGADGAATAGSDTLEIPDYRALEKAQRQKTANFFVFDINTNIFVGNSVETLDIVEVNGTKTAISPDGKCILYMQEKPEPSCVYLYRIDDKSNKRLNFPVALSAANPVFSPGGGFAAATLSRNDGVSLAALYDLRKDTFKIISKGGMSVYNPTFSPEGEKIVFHDMEKVYVYDFNGEVVKNYRTVSCENFCTQNDMGISKNCKFQISDNGRYIYYTYNCYSDTVLTSVVLARYAVDEGISSDLSPKGKFCTDFQLSQDGCLYYLLQKSADNDSDGKMYVIDRSGGKAVQIKGRSFDTPCSFAVSY